MEPATRRFLLVRIGAGFAFSLTDEGLRQVVEVPTVEGDAFADVSTDWSAIAGQRRTL